MVRQTAYGYNLTDSLGVDNITVSHYDPHANRFRVHYDFIREGWLYITTFKKYLRRFVPLKDIDGLVKEMKQNLRKEDSGYR